MEFSKIEKLAFIAGYRLSDDGLTLIHPNGRRLKQFIATNGYARCTLFMEEDRKTVGIHRFVAWMKYGESIYQPGIVCRHLDCDKLNNSFENIAIGTQKDNYHDTPQSIRQKNRKIGGCKYNHEEVLASYKEIGFVATRRKFNMGSNSVLYEILFKAKSATFIPKQDRPPNRRLMLGKKYKKKNNHLDLDCSLP